MIYGSHDGRTDRRLLTRKYSKNCALRTAILSLCSVSDKNYFNKIFHVGGLLISRMFYDSVPVFCGDKLLGYFMPA